MKLREMAQKVTGAEQYCWRAFADALEVTYFIEIFFQFPECDEFREILSFFD